MSEAFEFCLQAGPRRRELCPVAIPLDAPRALLKGPVRVVDVETGVALAGQWDASGEKPVLVAIADTLQARETRRFRLELGESAAGVALSDRPGESVGVAIGGEFFTDYHYGAKWVRPFLYPILGPYGARLTRGFPVEEIAGENRDHPHHKSVWIAHGEVNGVDDWSEDREHGFQIHRGFSALESGPVFGRIAENLSWTNHAKTETILEEAREIRFYALPESQRLVDFAVRFTAGERPVLFGDTKEAGLLSVRVASSMDGSGRGRIETGAGAIGEKESWGRKAPWCDYSGPVATPWGDLWAGIAIFDHPQNPRYPTNWHVRDYGLMTANCFGLHDYFGTSDRPGDFTLAAGESLTFRYRLYIHAGTAEEGRVGEKFSDYVNPPGERSPEC